jgi:hypothetical protein
MTVSRTRPAAADDWLKGYYATRAVFSAAWVVLAFTIGRSLPPVASVLIIAYPLWDSLANLADARRNGGLRANPTQMLNMVASAIVTVAVAVALPQGFHPVLGVIGVWAALAGLLQLATGVRRWRSAAAQWPMILSGAQSTLAGTHFLQKAADAGTSVGVADVAPYAAFGALYFAISAIVLVVRRRSAQPA